MDRGRRWLPDAPGQALSLVSRAHCRQRRTGGRRGRDVQDSSRWRPALGWRVFYCPNVAGAPGMTWLAECSAAALGEALRVVAPELSGYPVTVPGPAGKQDPQWHSGSVPVGDQCFVKFAWSRPAALQLAHEIGILAALAREPAVPFLPEVVASSTDPLLLITRRVPGASLFEVIDSIDPDRAARQLVRFLAALHHPATRQRAEAAVGPLTGPVLPPASDRDLARPVRDVDPARSAPGRHPLVRLGRRRARHAWPGRARARRPARRQPGVGPRRTPAGGGLRDRRSRRAGVRAAHLSRSRDGSRPGAADRSHAPLPAGHRDGSCRPTGSWPGICARPSATRCGTAKPESR